jgi:AI-2 transport protein TqsA
MISMHNETTPQFKDGGVQALQEPLRNTNWALAILAFIAVIGALKATYSVTMPLAFALFIVALLWPVQKKLTNFMPRKAAFIATLLILLLVVAIFFGLLALSSSIIAKQAPQYSEQAQSTYRDLQTWATARGIDMPQDPSQLRERLSSGGGGGLTSGAGQLVRYIGLWILTFGFLALGLSEVPRFKEKIAKRLGSERDWVQVVDDIAAKFNRYFVVRTVIGFIQFVCTWIFAAIVGLDLAFVWALLSGLLNYIPTLGSLISVVPPGFFALFQFQDPGKAALVFFGLCFIQLGLGTFVDPILEGKQLQLSPLVVLFSIAFWGWVWGVAGALIGVPITVAFVIICRQFPDTQWISELLTNEDDKEKSKAEKTEKDNSRAPQPA